MTFPAMKTRAASPLVGIILLVLILAGPQGYPGTPLGAETGIPAPGAAKVLEELNYSANILVFPEAVRAKVTLEEVGPGRYRAEIKGRTEGLFAFLTGNWRGSLSTEMEYRDGLFRPLVYREFSERGGKTRLKEYRFDYDRQKVELFKEESGKPRVKHWETSLNGPMFDPLSFYYNRRLADNPVERLAGQKLTFQGIPYPKPDEITVRIGERAPEGRKIMVEMGDRLFEGERTTVYAYLDNEGVPVKAYSFVRMFGKVNIHLGPGGRRLNKKALLPVPQEKRALMSR